MCCPYERVQLTGHEICIQTSAEWDKPTQLNPRCVHVLWCMHTALSGSIHATWHLCCFGCAIGSVRLLSWLGVRNRILYVNTTCLLLGMLWRQAACCAPASVVHAWRERVVPPTQPMVLLHHIWLGNSRVLDSTHVLCAIQCFKFAGMTAACIW